MIFDDLNVFGSSLTLHANIGNAIAGDVIDFKSTKGAAILAAAAGGGARLVGYLREALDSADDNETIKIDFRCADDAALATNPVTLLTTGVLAHAAVQTLNSVLFDWEFPAIPAGKQYAGFWITIATTNASAGHAEVFVVPFKPSFPIAS